MPRHPSSRPPASPRPTTTELKRGFERRVGNERVVYVPRPGSKKLLVVFSFLDFTAYHRLRVLRGDHRMNLLFLRDTSNNFYCCNGSDEIFRRVLRRFTRGLDPKDITTYGVSMGGTGALFHALELGANAIAINPIVDWSASVRLTDHARLKQRLREIGKKAFVRLPELVRSRIARSAIHCQFNRDEMGIANAKAMASTSPEYGSIIFEFSNTPIHMAADEVLTPKGIYDRVALLAQLRRIRVPLFVYENPGDDIAIGKQRV